MARSVHQTHRRTLLMGGGGGRCRALKIGSSVFPLFTFSLLFTIHESISETHAKFINIHQYNEFKRLRVHLLWEKNLNYAETKVM